MARYPFKENVATLMEQRRGSITDVSWKSLERRYRRIERDLIMLHQKGEVSSLAPSKMSESDVKALITYRKGLGVGASDIIHDISALDQLLQSQNNTAVRTCLGKNPALRPTKRNARLPPLSDDTYGRILDGWSGIDHGDFHQVRAFAMVLLYIGTGARNKELRLADLSDLDTGNWLIHFRHVKGEDSYGDPRHVPVPAEIRGVVTIYLERRDAWLRAHGAVSDALFFAMDGRYSHLSSNSVRKIKQRVERAIGEEFELRDCRRAFGQIYLNKGLEIEKVSVLMGHATTKTTETYYCRNCSIEAANRAKELW